MSDYRIRNGIVLEEICGIYLLISTEAAREYCDYIRKIDIITAYYWEMMEQRMSIEEMVSAASAQFKDIPKEQLRVDLLELIQMLQNLGYLLKEDERE